MTRRFWVAFLVIALCGCGSAAVQTQEIFGTVTFAGKPVSAGRVQMLAVDGSNSASAELTPEGSYRITGGPVGPVQIAVQTKAYILQSGPPAAAPADDQGSFSRAPVRAKNPLYVSIPAKYESFATSGLSTTIPARKGAFEHNLELLAE